MNKKTSSQPAISGTAVALLDRILLLATSPDPAKRAAGWLILAGCFLAYLAGDTPGPLL